MMMLFALWAWLLLRMCQGLILPSPRLFTATPPSSLSSSQYHTALFQSVVNDGHATSITIVKSAGEEEDIARAANFMVDEFWLGSPRQWAKGTKGSDVTEAARAKLVQQQTLDFMQKYGPRMGQRMCDSLLLEARSGSTLLGLVGLEVTLLNTRTGTLLSMETAETKLKQAVACLGPKQRREYKNASVQQIASELLNTQQQLQAVCCLSNLSIATAARRQGVALRLCQELERVVALDVGYDSLLLKVECDNAAARTLYETKLGYSVVAPNGELENDAGFRVNPETGDFVETSVSTVLLYKDL